MAERCRGWDSDAAWHGTVPLGLYAQAVHGVCGFVLSEDELCQLLCAVHPEQGEPPGGKLPCGNQPPISFGQFARSSSGQPPASASLGQPRPASANWQVCSGWLATPALFFTQVSSCASSLSTTTVLVESSRSTRRDRPRPTSAARPRCLRSGDQRPGLRPSSKVYSFAIRLDSVLYIG